MKDTITARVNILREIYHKNDYYTLACQLLEPNKNIHLNSYNNFIIAGNLGYLNVGHTYTLVLSETQHKKYGVQYQVEQVPMFENLTDISPDDNLTLLMEITTETQARYIQDAYPDFVSKILEGREEEIDLNKIYNVGEVYFKVYCQRIKDKFAFFQLQSNFTSYNLSRKECNVLCKKYGNTTRAIDRLKEYPYLTLQFELGRSWGRVDGLLKEERLDLIESPQRCECLILHILQMNENDGSTRMNARTMSEFAAELAPELLPIMKEVAIKGQYIYYEESTNYISISETYEGELKTANLIKTLLQDPKNFGIEWEKYCKNDDIELTNEQKELLNLVNQHSLVLLTGSAGSGKTESVNALIKMLDDNGYTYSLLAPTGIASKRLTESTHKPAMTIHRAFASAETLYKDVIVIDEISMCGVEHLQMLCTIIDPQYSKVVIIGDEAQLASIPCGNVLNDLLRYGKIPRANLTKVFRYGKGSLDTVATDVRNGEQYLTPTGELCFQGAGNDCQYEFYPIDKNPLNQVMDAYAKLRETYEDKDIIILTPFNVGEFGTYAINNAIQSLHNPQTEVLYSSRMLGEVNGICFGVKDRVLNVVNNYEAEVYSEETWDELDNEQTASIFNGDCGVVRNVNTKDKYMAVQFDEEMIKIDSSDINNLLLGYAMTIHKVQGNQSKAVILITHPCHSQLLSNNLLYVALTRAQEKIIHFGDVKTINKALQIYDTTDRDTWLFDLLERGINEDISSL